MLSLLILALAVPVSAAPDQQDARRRLKILSDSAVTVPVPVGREMGSEDRPVGAHDWQGPPLQVGDLSGQFGDPPTRCQLKIGSCHAFSTIAIVEAAYSRHYKESVRFSEADLFIQRTVLDHDQTWKGKVVEGDDIQGDVRYALKNGVVTGFEYESFAERYARWVDRAVGREGVMKPRTLAPEHRARLRTAYEKALTDGEAPMLAVEREKFRRKLEGFRMVAHSQLGGSGYDDPVECRKKGGVAAGVLLAELAQKRPVAVGMDLTGLKKWHATPDRGRFMHAFAITAYEWTEADGYVFETRNSWGGINPPVREDELCRMLTIVTVLAPGENGGPVSAGASTGL